jgi:hypothetical protein
MALVGGSLAACSVSIGIDGGSSTSSSGSGLAPDDTAAITQTLEGLTPTVDECVQYGSIYCSVIPENLGVLTWPASSTADYQAFLQDLSDFEQMGGVGMACYNPEYSSMATNCVQPARASEAEVVVSAFNKLLSDFGLAATTMPPMPT